MNCHVWGQFNGQENWPHYLVVISVMGRGVNCHVWGQFHGYGNWPHYLVVISV